MNSDFSTMFLVTYRNTEYSDFERAEAVFDTEVDASQYAELMAHKTFKGHVSGGGAVFYDTLSDEGVYYHWTPQYRVIPVPYHHNIKEK